MNTKATLYRKIFLHFFDIHFLELKGYDNANSKLKKYIEHECKLATRMALLASDCVLVPAASYFESDLCYEVLDELARIYPTGLIYLVGGGSNIDEYLEGKLQSYSSTSPLYKRYKTRQKRISSHPPFLTRRNSATRDIVHGWMSLQPSAAVARITSNSDIKLPKNFETKWQRVPEQLEGRAFITDHVAPLLIGSVKSTVVKHRLHGIINEHYFDSFTREYCAGVITEMVYLGAPHSIPSYDRDLSFKELRRELQNNLLVNKVLKADGEQLERMRMDSQIQKCIIAASGSEQRSMVQHDISAALTEKLLSVTIGIVTALPEEFASVSAIFDCENPINVSNGRKYSFGRIKTKDNIEHVVAVTMLVDMGNNLAAIAATELTFDCKNLKFIIMSGIAGAVPNPEKPSEHVRLGDIVVSSRSGVVQYDLDKETVEKTEVRNPPRPPAPELLEAARYLQAEEMQGRYRCLQIIEGAIQKLGTSWTRPNDASDVLRDSKDGIIVLTHPIDKERQKGCPRVHLGPIASANKLLKNPIKRDALRDKFGVKAVEMEGSGIADASWRASVGYIVVRGTCDYCNADKGDDWHKYAALIAAAYSRALIESL